VAEKYIEDSLESKIVISSISKHNKMAVPPSLYIEQAVNGRAFGLNIEQHNYTIKRRYEDIKAHYRKAHRLFRKPQLLQLKCTKAVSTIAFATSGLHNFSSAVVARNCIKDYNDVLRYT
jgi:hypothetical protein